MREDSAPDSMWRALQRLLREKALDFSKNEVTEAELKQFCGMKPEENLFFGEDPPLDGHETEEDDRASTASHTSRAARNPCANG